MIAPLILLAVAAILAPAAVAYRRDRAAWRACEKRWADETIAMLRTVPRVGEAVRR